MSSFFFSIEISFDGLNFMIIRKYEEFKHKLFGLLAEIKRLNTRFQKIPLILKIPTIFCVDEIY